MTLWLQDLHYARRALVRRPGTTVTILFTLALGIGATTALFSVVEGVLLRPLPYEDPESLVQIWTQYPEYDAFEFPASRAEYVDYRDESELYEKLAAYTIMPVTLTGTGEPLRLRASLATASLWDVLGAEALAGRTFLATEDRPGSDGVVVISHGLWQRRFGGDPGMLGESLTIEDIPRQIVGIMPPDFRFPESDVDLWMPVAIDESAITVRHGHFLMLLGRMRPDVTMSQVLAELEVIVTRWSEQYEHAHPMTALPLLDQVLGGTARPLVLLLAATGLVLLIACVNVAGLLRAREPARLRSRQSAADRRGGAPCSGPGFRVSGLADDRCPLRPAAGTSGLANRPVRLENDPPTSARWPGSGRGELGGDAGDGGESPVA